MSMDDLRNLLSDDEYAGLEEYLSESESENLVVRQSG